MNLEDWIKEKGWSKVEFAKRLGVSRNTVYTWINGRIPSKYTAKRIMELTNGKVKYTKNKTQIQRTTN